MPVEPRDDKEISRILVVNAHPDDADFGVGGTVAKLAAKGIEITYVCCTNGDQGGEESGVPQEEMAATRQREQRDAARVLGVKDVIYLNYRDGHLEPTLGLRKDIVRQIRIHKPDRMLIQSPERNWDRIGASHPDHLAAGEAAIQAVNPDARNPFAFMDLKNEEGLEPWRVKEVWVYAHHSPDYWVDITETFPKKMAALNAHVSQTAHNKELERMVREWAERNAGVGGLPVGHLAEAFKIVNTD